MARLLLSLLLFSTSCIAIAQDSIRLLYDRYASAKGQEKAKLANQLCQQMKEKDETDSLYRFDKSDKTMDFIILKSMANHYMVCNNNDSALSFCKRAISIYKPGLCEEEYADVLNISSVLCQRLGRFYEALSAQKECYEYDMKSGNPENISSSTNNLACLYLATRQYEAAEHFITKSIEIEQTLNREDRLAIRYGTASEIYLNLDRLTEALKYAKMAYQLDEKGHRDEKMAIRQSQMASVLIKMDKISEARDSIEKALPVLKRHGNLYSQTVCHNQLGDIFLSQGKKELATAEFREAISLSQQSDFPLQEKNAQKGLSQALAGTNPSEALSSLQRYTELSDSLYKEESASQLNQFHSIFMAQELNEKNALLNHKNTAQRRRLIYLSVSFALIVLFLSVLAFILYRLLLARNHANSLMKEIEEMRLDFFSKITHEFRAPLTIINGLSEHIAQGKTASEDETRHAAEMILRNGMQLQQLTNQLLDISRLRASDDHPRWRNGDIVAYTKLIAETFSQLAFKRGISLQYQHLSHDRSTIDFVPDFYNKIMYNLLSNAMKFTPSGGSVSITTAVDDDKITLTVADTGIGIPQKDMPHIFEEYYIGDVDGSTFSTGVGLALVKEICDTLHGTIQVESEEGKGTTFTLTMPAKSPQGDATPLFETETSQSPYPLYALCANSVDTGNRNSAEKPKILIVEDNEDVSRFIALLESEDFQIIYADNGADGLEKAQDSVPDLIVSDLMMPKMNGIELCRKIRSDEMLSHIPFIIITANSDEKERMKGLDSGADSYLLKPFNVEELNILIHRLIEQRENMRRRFSAALQQGDEEKEEMLMPKKDAEFLQKLDQSIYRQMGSGNTDVETIASILCVSSKQLRRKIYAMTGMTSVAYILHVRLSKAKDILQTEPQMPIAEISLKCGFEDSGYFTKVFKQHYGMTPSAYRKEGKASE